MMFTGVSCFECSNKYYGETIKYLDTRISQQKYDVSRFKKCNAMCRHTLEKNPFIDWKNALFVFNNRNKEVLQIVEAALISKLPNFNLSSCFYNLTDNIAQDLISEQHI